MRSGIIDVATTQGHETYIAWGGHYMFHVRKLLLVTLALGVCGGEFASAADLPQRPAYQAPAVVMPAPSWTGCYIGGNVGYAWGRAEVESPVGTASATNSGATAGGQIGCDYQF